LSCLAAEIADFLGPICHRFSPLLVVAIPGQHEARADASVNPGNICGIVCNNPMKLRRCFSDCANSGGEVVALVARYCHVSAVTIIGCRQYYC
jgi:hypothetical protein